MNKFVFEGQVNCEKEDDGQALIATIDQSNILEADEETGMFVRIQSWDTSRKHATMNTIEGKRVRVTIEVIE